MDLLIAGSHISRSLTGGRERQGEGDFFTAGKKELYIRTPCRREGEAEVDTHKNRDSNNRYGGGGGGRRSPPSFFLRCGASGAATVMPSTDWTLRTYKFAK